MKLCVSVVESAKVLSSMRRCLFAFLLIALGACSTRVRGPHGIVGGRVADGFFYIVPVDGGVVLVDTGEQSDGAFLRELAAQRPVVAVLVTHAHHDHYAAAHTFASVPVYVGAEDIRRMRGETQHQGAIQRAQRERNGVRTTFRPCLTTCAQSLTGSDSSWAIVCLVRSLCPDTRREAPRFSLKTCSLEATPPWLARARSRPSMTATLTIP